MISGTLKIGLFHFCSTQSFHSWFIQVFFPIRSFFSWSPQSICHGTNQSRRKDRNEWNLIHNRVGFLFILVQRIPSTLAIECKLLDAARDAEELAQPFSPLGEQLRGNVPSCWLLTMAERPQEWWEQDSPCWLLPASKQTRSPPNLLLSLSQLNREVSHPVPHHAACVCRVGQGE